MSYSLTVPINTGSSGQTLRIAGVNADGTPHATIRDLAVTEIAQGVYQFVTTAIPYSYNGTLILYTGTLGVATVWTGVTIQSADGLQEIFMLAAIKAAVYDTATVTGTAITLIDGAVQTVIPAGRTTT